MKKLITLITGLLFTFTGLCFAQEALKSTEEEYYDFLSLTGVVERPTLGYRTLSDSVWNFQEVESFEENEDGTFTKVRTPGEESDGNIWKKNNLGTTYTLWEPDNKADNWFARGLKQGLTLRVYGPEWFNSYNTAVPYGQNDGALWQGRGYNTALTAGLRLEGYGFELTFKPQVSWSQNKEFELIKPNYGGELYKDKAEKYGYYGVPSIDAPQRFGDKAFWNYDWGDTEIRYSWHNFTFGFGTQTIWLGPAYINPIIHSNNAASYPKIDIGLRKTDITMPFFGWDLGSIEARGWWGKLTESDWFDNDDNNNDNLIAGISLSYQFPFFDALTLNFQRTMVSKFNNISAYTLFDIFVPFMQAEAGVDESDGRASVSASLNIPKAGFILYLEWGRDDFQKAKYNFIRYPFHTQGWTAGLKKTLNFTTDVRSEILLELTELVCSEDYTHLYKYYTTFYGHHRITQGYTNKGQWLGPGIGTGGNSQYLGINVYYPKGKTSLYVNRINPDLDYSWFINTYEQSMGADYLETFLVFGMESSYFVRKDFLISAFFKPTFILSKNYSYFGEDWNFNFGCNLSYKF